MKKSYYISTTLPYVNADPHIGFALEVVQADVLARFWRLVGDEVFFNTGTDEHGQKIYEAAQNAGQDVHEYVDHYAAEFQKLGQVLDLSNDAFIRTTAPHHYGAAQEMWKRCDAAGDIYKKAYEGLYCVGCERFLSERDMDGGKCRIHAKEPVPLKEENYFFKFSNYQEQLRTYLSQPGVIVPEWRREEAIAFVKEGLEDFSISREKERLPWGVPVPGDDTQRMYVWFDALTNYISTLGWPADREGNFKKFWEDGYVLQVAGKDQVRFQSLMWQAMLMSAGVKTTDSVFYHGFINSGGHKMSKSLGNVISPYGLVERYGTDATRYLLLRHVHPFEDTDITWERLDEWYTAHLVNGLGNVVARVMKLAEVNLVEPITKPDASEFSEEVSKATQALEFNIALDMVWKRITSLDEKITETEPFKLVKGEPERGRALVAECAAEVYGIGVLLRPFLPETSERIQKTVFENKKPENLFPRL